MGNTPESRSIGHLLGQICRLHHHRAHTLFEEVGLHRGQPELLFALWEEEGRTHSELAAILHVQPATITRMVQRMERVGFVERRDDPDDKRISRVYLTDRGRKIRSDVQEIWHTLEAETLGGFTTEEQAGAKSLLLRVRENLIQATGMILDH